MASVLAGKIFGSILIRLYMSLTLVKIWKLCIKVRFEGLFPYSFSEIALIVVHQILSSVSEVGIVASAKTVRTEA